MKIISIKPNLRVSNFIPKAGMEKNVTQEIVTTTTVATPIGLLLALTREITTSTTTYSGGISPNARILTS